MKEIKIIKKYIGNKTLKTLIKEYYKNKNI